MPEQHRYSVAEWDALRDCCGTDDQPVSTRHRLTHDGRTVRGSQVDWIYRDQYQPCVRVSCNCAMYYRTDGAIGATALYPDQWMALPVREGDPYEWSSAATDAARYGFTAPMVQQWSVGGHPFDEYTLRAGRALLMDYRMDPPRHETTNQEEQVVSIDTIVSELLIDYNTRTWYETVQETRKVKADIKRVYKAFIKGLTTFELLTFDNYLTLNKTDEEGGWIIQEGFDGIYMDITRIMGHRQVPYTTARAAIKEQLPKWVKLTRKGTFLFVSTDKGSAWETALRNEWPSDGIIRISIRGEKDTVSAYALTDLLLQISKFRKNYAKQILARMRLNSSVKEHKLQKEVRSGLGDLDKFLNEVRRTRRTHDQIINRFPIPAHGLRSSRNWGIEVETAGARGVKTPRFWDNKYDGSLSSAYEEMDGPDECDLDHDENFSNYISSGTNTPTANGNYCGIPRVECETCIAYDLWENGDGDEDCREFVSPILHSFHSKGLEQLVKEISTQPQNDSAGIHVHVDVADLTAKQVGSLAYGYNIIEPLLEASYQRTTREYCGRRESEDLKYIGIQIKSNPMLKPREIRTNTRYTALNLESMRSHGTIEFRAMGPVYDYEYLIRWAYLCRELVNVAKAGVKPREWNAITSFEKLQKLFISRGAESTDNSMSIMTQDDFESMAAKNRDADIYVPEEEYALVGGEI